MADPHCGSGPGKKHAGYCKYGLTLLGRPYKCVCGVSPEVEEKVELSIDEKISQQYKENNKWELLAKRLLAANQLGVYIKSADGHRWLVTGCPPQQTSTCEASYELMESNFNATLQEQGIFVNSKVYGSFSEALDIIEAALRKYNGNKKGLLDVFYEDVSNNFKGEKDSPEDEQRLLFEPANKETLIS